MVSLKFIVLGIPTWALVDGTWSALSQLANNLPEGYTISSYLILSLTLGNFVPLGLGYFLRNESPSSTKFVIRTILIVGFVTGVLLSAFWESSVVLANSNQRISLPLYILFFVVGACSSASNVTHFMFVSNFDAVNTSALATGMGIGSMVAGLLAILQGTVLQHSGFGVSYFYLVLALLYLPAIAALHFIEEKEYQRSVDNSYEDKFASGSCLVDGTGESGSPRATTGLMGYSERDFLRDHSHVLLVQMTSSMLGYGLVPAMASLACSKFNNRTLVLLLATGLTAVIDPLFKALTAYVRIETVAGLKMSVAVQCLLTAGLLLCVVLPSSLSIYQGAGGVLPILLYVGFGALFGFTNTCGYRYFKHNVPEGCMHHSYRWGGMATQSGALIGSLVAFCLVVTGTIS